MKIIITTLLWQRYEIFEIWAEAALRLINDFSNTRTKISVVVAGSEGEQSKSLVEGFGFHYVEVPNMPLGRKANFRMLKCRDLKPDWVVFLGSDDIISSKTFRYLLKQMRKGYDAIHNMDLYYYDTISGYTVYNCGYINHRRGEPMAPGKCLSAKLLKRMKWKLWDDDLLNTLDFNLRKKLEKRRYKKHIYSLKEKGLMIMDIKGKNNITPFRMRPNYTIIEFSKVSAQFPEAYKLLAL